MQVIVYCRFSDTTQGKGTSIERQKELAAEVCLERGWDFGTAEFLIDRGRSAYHAEHRMGNATFAKFEAEVRAGYHRGKVLVLERLDRLSREKPLDSFNLMQAVMQGGVSIATAEGNFYRAGDDIGFEKIMMIFIEAKVAHEQSVEKQKRGNKRWEARRRDMEAGKVTTALCPGWLAPSADRSHWVIIGEGKGPHVDRGEVVRRIFSLAADGLGSEQIAKRLNADRIPPWPRFSGEKRKPPTAWSRGFVLRIMTNLAVIGDHQPMKFDDQQKRVPAGDPLRGYFPRIVQPDVFERVQSMAGARKDVRGRKSAVVANLVSGLALCEHCGGKMEYRRGRKAGSVVKRNGKADEPIKVDTGSLVCPKAAHKLDESNPAYCDNRRWIAYLGFERSLLDSCLHLAMDDGAFAQHDVIAELNVRIADVRRDADIATKRAEALWLAYANPTGGQAPSAMAMKLAQTAEEEAGALNSQVTELETQRRKAGGEATAVEQMSRLAAIRDSLYADDLEKRGETRSKVAVAMRAIIEKIVCQSDGSSVVVFKHGLRMVRLVPGVGRRPASFVAVDLAKEGEAYDGKDRPVIERFMQRRSSSKP